MLPVRGPLGGQLEATFEALIGSGYERVAETDDRTPDYDLFLARRKIVIEVNVYHSAECGILHGP